MKFNVKAATENLDNAISMADKIAAARRAGGLFVTKDSPGAEQTPERILFDAASKTPAEMLGAYRKKYAAFGTMPLDPAGDRMRYFRGQWSIFSGYTGTGKTTNLRQMVCHWLREDPKAVVFVATLEQDPEDYLIEIASTACGVEEVNEAQLTAFLDEFGGRLKIWGRIGVAEHKKILATIRDIATELKTIEGEHQFYAIIDSLMVLDIDTGNFEAQRQFAALLSATVHAHQIHIVLVAHPKKPMAPEQEPSTSDVSGSSHLGNLSYNVLFIRRGMANPGMGSNITPMEVHILKRRKGGTLGVISGCYYFNHNQFHVDAYSQSPTPYLSAKDIYPATGMTDEIPESILAKSSYVERDEVTKAPWEID